MRDGKNDLTDSELILPPQVRSFFWFHVYFTVRRILFELGGPQNSLPLPGDTAFNQTENKYDIPSFERICAEFGISPNADFRFTRGDNHGLGSVFEYFSYSGYTKTPFKYPSKETKFEDEGGRASDGNLVPYIENTEARNQYEYFLCPVSHGLTSAGLSRINQSIESFCYAILGSQVDVCSSISGSQGSAIETQRQFLSMVENAIRNPDISKSVQRFQLAIESAKVRLDLAISPGLWLLPSKITTSFAVEDSPVSFGVDFISVLFLTNSCWGEDSSTAFGGSFFLFSKIPLIFVIKFPVNVFTVLRIGSGTKLIT